MSSIRKLSEVLPRLPAGEQKELAARYGLRVGAKLYRLGLEKAKNATEPLSTAWQGWLLAPRPGYYQLMTGANERCRILIDGKPVLDTLKDQGVPESIVLLTGVPQPLRIEHPTKHWDSTTPRLPLSWSLMGGFGGQPVPAQALYH